MGNDTTTPSILAAAAYHRVFRTDFEQPGFAIINLGSCFGSQEQRRLMVQLKGEFAEKGRERCGRTLVYQSLGRFDQQVTTKPHRDGGPNESILMLGYEPTVVPGRVYMSDYSRCAFDMGLTPAEFLNRYNPMFPDGQERLTNYTTEVADFDHSSFQILIINNSIVPQGDNQLQGVLHTADIIEPDREQLRVVNSTMIGSGKGVKSAVSDSEVDDFTTTDMIRMAAYEK